MTKVILDLCGGTGSWSLPYFEGGYAVIIVDPCVEIDFGNYKGTVSDLLVDIRSNPIEVHGVLAAPPCTDFCVSGAQWWAEKDMSGSTMKSVQVVKDCLEVVRLVKPKWWALENPVGRIEKIVSDLGQPRLKFDPCDYGDPYTKRTWLWGDFAIPKTSYIDPEDGSAHQKLPPSKDRSKIRAITPRGFANAFFQANP